MKRYPALSVEEVLRRLDVDLETGRCYWIDATKYHRSLSGKEAGYTRYSTHNKKHYWVIGFDGTPHKRSYIVFLVSKGYWPTMIDHIDGDSLNDKPSNLREATATQNNWNHHGRRKTEPVPMGVRLTRSGKFQARIACNKRTTHLGTFDTIEAAHAAYVSKRKELFGAFCGY